MESGSEPDRIYQKILSELKAKKTWNPLKIVSDFRKLFPPNTLSYDEKTASEQSTETIYASWFKYFLEKKKCHSRFRKLLHFGGTEATNLHQFYNNLARK